MKMIDGYRLSMGDLTSTSVGVVVSCAEINTAQIIKIRRVEKALLPVHYDQGFRSEIFVVGEIEPFFCELSWKEMIEKKIVEILR